MHSGGLATRRTGDYATWLVCPVGPKCFRAMRALAGHEDAEQERGVNLVPETWLTGPDGWGTKAGGRLLVALEEMFLPALVRGWVTAWSDCEGRVAYQTTEAGRASWLPQAMRAADLPELDNDSADTYLVALTAARNALAAAKPAKENSMTIPLSAGFGRANRPRRFRHCLTPRGGTMRNVATAGGYLYVFLEKLRCPRCSSDKLHTYKSHKCADGSTMRRTACLSCFLKFRVVVDDDDAEDGD